MTKPDPFKRFQSSPEIIRLAVMLYVRFPLSLRNVEDLLHECGIEISRETVRFWWQRFGPMFASETHKIRADRLRSWPQWRWHLDEMFSAGFARASPTMGTGQHGAQMRIGCGGDVTGDDLRLDAPAGKAPRTLRSWKSSTGSSWKRPGTARGKWPATCRERGTDAGVTGAGG